MAQTPATALPRAARPRAASDPGGQRPSLLPGQQQAEGGACSRDRSAQAEPGAQFCAIDPPGSRGRTLRTRAAIDRPRVTRGSSRAMAVEIKETTLGGNLRDFLDVVDYIYRDDPAYVRELDFDVRGRLSPKHPFFEHARRHHLHRPPQRLVRRALHGADRSTAPRALPGRRRVLRVPRHHRRRRGGPRAARRSGQWLAARGMKRMRGPFMLNINDQVGCLVEGFDTRR